MAHKLEFNEKAKQHVNLLKQYTPVLARVHGSSHPELAQVKDIVKSLTDKVDSDGHAEADLNEEFSRLREVTGNYEVPGDGCETYEAVYTMLSELDKAYQS